MPIVRESVGVEVGGNPARRPLGAGPAGGRRTGSDPGRAGNPSISGPQTCQPSQNGGMQRAWRSTYDFGGAAGGTAGGTAARPAIPAAMPAGGPSGMTPRAGAASAPCVALLVGAVLIAGCASGPPVADRSSGASSPVRPPGTAPAAAPRRVAPPDDSDGPADRPPPDLDRVPDAEPRLEWVRAGGPNKPYDMLGQAYVPRAGDPVMVERGLASWYGRRFHGRATATGESYDMYAMSAAHKTMPLPSYARVRNPANGREVVVRINDRGPFHGGRVIDLSYTAAFKLGLLGGVAPVEVERITYDAIRSGSWRGGRTLLAAAAPTADPPAPPPPPPPPPSPPAAVPAVPAAPAEAAQPRGDPIAAFAGGRDGQLPAYKAGDPVDERASKLAGASTVGPSVNAARHDTRLDSRRSLPPLPAPPPAGVPLDDGAAPRSAAKSAPGFWLQLGAFRDPAGSVGFRQQVAREADWLAPLLAIFTESRLHRLQAGPFASRADAGQAADRLRAALSLATAIVERR